MPRIGKMLSMGAAANTMPALRMTGSRPGTSRKQAAVSNGCATSLPNEMAVASASMPFGGSPYRLQPTANSATGAAAMANMSMTRNATPGRGIRKADSARPTQMAMSRGLRARRFNVAHKRPSSRTSPCPPAASAIAMDRGIMIMLSTNMVMATPREAGSVPSTMAQIDTPTNPEFDDDIPRPAMLLSAVPPLRIMRQAVMPNPNTSSEPTAEASRKSKSMDSARGLFAMPRMIMAGRAMVITHTPMPRVVSRVIRPDMTQI